MAQGSEPMAPTPGGSLLRWAALLLLSSALAACSTTRPVESREGTIVYHEEPAAPDTSKKEAPQPFTRIFTTHGGEKTAQGGVQTFAGVIEGSGDTRSASDAESDRIAQMIFENARQKSTTVLTQEKFGDLWSRLESVGLTDLQPYGGNDPPQGHSYFLLESGSVRKIFARPSVSSSRADEASIQLLKCWLKARFELINFLNELQWTSS